MIEPTKDKIKKAKEECEEMQRLEHARDIRRQITIELGTSCTEYDRADALVSKWWEHYERKCKEVEDTMAGHLKRELANAERYEARYVERKFRR